MYAVIRQGSHQYRVSPGDTIQVELLRAEQGSELDLEDVLMLSDGETVEVGTPRVAGATVRARVLREDKSPKIVIYKFKKRKDSARKKGHRQPFTELKIQGIYKDGQELHAD
ncbi:50S ribosomal protein L21 [Candidatus Poribacteria bacterium]|nr:50S ribosomal protein L21 [Candidatus Poribacteria bacterium]